MGYIYKVTNKVNGKVYIGKTENDVNTRWNSHVSNSFRKDSKEYNFKFHRAIRKYGRDAFSIDTIDETDAQETALREQYWIEFYDSIKTGYNTTFGGEGSTRYSDQFLMDCWKTGMTQDEIQKVYGISRNTVAARYRSFLSKEEITKRKLYNLKKANGTQVYQYDLDGNYVGTFVSVNEAKRQTGVNHIDAVARGKRNHAGGFIWSYEKHDRIEPIKTRKVKRGERIELLPTSV